MAIRTKNQLRENIETIFIEGGELTIEELKDKIIDIIDSAAWGTELVNAHTHNNKAILDLLAESGGELTWNGLILKTASLAWSAITGKPLGLPSGVATLDATGKIPFSQIPELLAGALAYQGAYDANLNNPAIPTASTSNNGYYYKVSIAGTQNLGNGIIEFSVGDLIISNGTFWEKIDQISDVIEWEDIAEKPSTFVPSAHTHNINDVFNLQAELNNLKVSNTTGINISFDKAKIYNTASAAGVGNIVFDFTNAIKGTTVKLYHSDTSVPTLQNSAKKLSGSGNYVTGVLNIIYFDYEDNNNVYYSIQQLV